MTATCPTIVGRADGRSIRFDGDPVCSALYVYIESFGRHVRSVLDHTCSPIGVLERFEALRKTFVDFSGSLFFKGSWICHNHSFWHSDIEKSFGKSPVRREKNARLRDFWAKNVLYVYCRKPAKTDWFFKRFAHKEGGNGWYSIEPQLSRSAVSFLFTYSKRYPANVLSMLGVDAFTMVKYPPPEAWFIAS